jgi:hypothetical protein
MLCEMIRIFAASVLYLYMGGHVGVIVGGGGGSGHGSGFFPGHSDYSVFDRAVGAGGSVVGGGASSGDAIATFVVNVRAHLTMAVWAMWVPVLVGWIVLSAEAAGGACVRFAGRVVVARLLASAALVGLGGRVEFCDSPGFKEHHHLVLF